MYKPNPIDTTDIVLSEEIDLLVEKLAENAHEIWAKKRIEEGWTFGEKRNDDFKKHPCLISYGELPQSEKEYDRKLATETIKVIIAMGFKILK